MMNDYDNFPTPAEIAPADYGAPPLNEKWEASVMEEIAALLRRSEERLQSGRGVRFIPVARRDMGEAAAQWQHYSSYVADLVRNRGWQVMHVKSSSEKPVLVIYLPGRARVTT